MDVFGPCNPRPALPEFFFVIGCHKPGKLVAVLVISGNDVSLHFFWSSCRGLHERGAGSRIRLGLLSALWHATPRAKLQAFKFTPSICRNNARNSMATTDGFSLLDRAVSNGRNDRPLRWSYVCSICFSVMCVILPPRQTCNTVTRC